MPRIAARQGKRAVPDAAFDLWLRRGLHAMYDDVAREPVPEELLKLIEQDRQK
ncbi:NepR family anti-sigma factor [Plastoroseomonas hellenica]|nr:NepR family anti-sigma factor [Plastoroseomonas hellenica]